EIGDKQTQARHKIGRKNEDLYADAVTWCKGKIVHRNRHVMWTAAVVDKGISRRCTHVSQLAGLSLAHLRCKRRSDPDRIPGIDSARRGVSENSRGTRDNERGQ